MAARQFLRHLGRADVELVGDPEAEQHGHERRELHPERHFVEIVQDVVVRQREQRRLPEMLVVIADEIFVEDDAGEQRAGRQHGQRHQHHRRRFMHMVHDVGGGARPAVEGHEDQPPGIEAGQARRRAPAAMKAKPAMALWPAKAPSMMASLEKKPAVPMIVAGNADAGQRQRADHHHPVGRGDQRAQAAHLAHVLLVGDGMDDRARAEEQQRLEEGMGEQVEDRRRVEAQAERHEHVAELRAGRIGDDALDVVLHQADGRGEEGGEGADEGHDGQRRMRQLEERRQPRQHEHAGRDHGRRMDERRHRRRAFHGVRQPGVQRHLRRLAHRAHEEQQADDRQRALLVERIAEEVQHGLAMRAGFRAMPGRGQGRGIGEDRVEIDRAEQHEHAENAEDEAEIADAVDDEGLDRRGVGRRLLVPEADQQVGGEAHALPSRRTSARDCPPSPASAWRR